MHTTWDAIRRRPGRRRGGAIRVGPEDHGRRMPLAEFSRADGVPGYCYELANGVVEVTNIPNFSHYWICQSIRNMLVLYQAAHPGQLFTISGSLDSKIELPGRGSERHPDLSVYLSPPPEGVEQPWDRWTPELVVEVVSPSSARRDYDDKPADYLAAGVREYWIIDPSQKCGLFHVRRTDSWTTSRVGSRGRWKSPLLHGFTLELAKVFARPPRARRGR